MNATQVKSLISNKNVGRHSVGNGLYLRVTKDGSGYWVVRYSIYGKRREIAIGKHPVMSMAKANLDAAQIKLDVSEGLDPLSERNREDNTQLELVNDLAEDWFKECDKRLKYPNIPKQVYRDYIAPTLG